MGPRPPLPSEVAQYDERAMRRLSVKPGLTGYWQVRGRSDTTFDDMVDMDLWEVVAGSVLVCVVVGVALYWCESLVRRRIKRFRAQTAALRELDPAKAVIPR